jgi:hypothetical protein
MPDATSARGHGRDDKEHDSHDWPATDVAMQSAGGWQAVCIGPLAMTVEVRYRPPDQYDVLISKHDDDRSSMITCASAAEVGTTICRVADQVGWNELRLPILVGGQRPRGAAALPDDLKQVLADIVLEHRRQLARMGLAPRQ